MAWIKINKRCFVNADRISDVKMLKKIDGSHYIKFLINGDDWRTSKCFNSLEECEEIFDKLWLAISSNKSIDISKKRINYKSKTWQRLFTKKDSRG
nr:MAG TPA: hypothetical protein [Caudoviricetes sp.]